MKVALVHDYLNEYGGAERVLEALCEIWPKAPIYTSFYKKGSTAYERFKTKDIRTSWAQKVPFFASYLHSPLRFLAPLIWGSFDFSGYDVVITSASWYITKGVALAKPPFAKASSGKPIEVCYCHTPPRYLYGYATAADYKHNFFKRVYALVVNHFMRVYDYEAAQRVDYFVANSREVQARIKKFYRRESKVIYPPIDVKQFTVNSLQLTDKKQTVNREPSTVYFLTVSRLSAAKNTDVIVQVCAKLGLPLKVVGTGKEFESLKKLAEEHLGGEKSTIEFLGEVNDQELTDLYRNCRALIFAASQEDFGIVPVEAMAAGKPVIALAEGGVLETVVDAIPAGKGKGTGVYFDPATTGSLTLAINNFVSLEKKGYFDPKFIRAHAQKFSKERSKREIGTFVTNKVDSAKR